MGTDCGSQGRPGGDRLGFSTRKAFKALRLNAVRRECRGPRSGSRAKPQEAPAPWGDGQRPARWLRWAVAKLGQVGTQSDDTSR